MKDKWQKNIYLYELLFTILLNLNDNLRNLSFSVLSDFKYECHFCLKKFNNSWALGGHQNVYQKERMKRKGMDLQAKTY